MRTLPPPRSGVLSIAHEAAHDSLRAPDSGCCRYAPASAQEAHAVLDGVQSENQTIPSESHGDKYGNEVVSILPTVCLHHSALVARTLDGRQCKCRGRSAHIRPRWTADGVHVCVRWQSAREAGDCDESAHRPQLDEGTFSCAGVTDRSVTPKGHDVLFSALRACGSAAGPEAAECYTVSIRSSPGHKKCMQSLSHAISLVARSGTWDPD